MIKQQKTRVAAAVGSECDTPVLFFVFHIIKKKLREWNRILRAVNNDLIN